MAQPASLTPLARIVFPQAAYESLQAHLFQADRREHAAVVLAGLANTPEGPRLLAREIVAAREPQDYRIGENGHMSLQASFIHRYITQCRDRHLVYLAAHNHGGSGRVAFSDVDLASHERGYGALLDIAEGMPVGALVLANEAIETDLWLSQRARTSLRSGNILKETMHRVYPNPNMRARTHSMPLRDGDFFDRQALLFGQAGQSLLQSAKIAVIGLGGIGALVSEYLARLGVGSLVLIDPDRIEASNFSRIVGARTDDIKIGSRKIDIANRLAREAQPAIHVDAIAGDFARLDVAQTILNCDYLFLAADSMRARLVFNAIVQQYFIPGVQLGSKIVIDPKSGAVTSAFSVVRHVRPGIGCLLCNQLIDASKLADEWKTDSERKDQQYGVAIPNPSVITLNAVAAAHAVNDFLFYYIGVGSGPLTPYRRFDHLSGKTVHEHPRRDETCPECSQRAQSRYGYGDARPLPCAV